MPKKPATYRRHAGNFPQYEPREVQESKKVDPFYSSVKEKNRGQVFVRRESLAKGDKESERFFETFDWNPVGESPTRKGWPPSGSESCVVQG